ncbi:hypothetical protein EDC04DRAFT_2598915 [Pisolithus marmoratus]|nr:hypothetical protein EDC04DRAFT_2598915 [Pisolithus marmoratus]
MSVQKKVDDLCVQGIIDTQATAVQQAHAQVSEMEATMEVRQLTEDTAKARPVRPRQAPVSRGRPTNISVQPCVEDIGQGTSPPVVMEARWAIQDATKGKLFEQATGWESSLPIEKGSAWEHPNNRDELQCWANHVSIEKMPQSNGIRPPPTSAIPSLMTGSTTFIRSNPGLERRMLVPTYYMDAEELEDQPVSPIRVVGRENFRLSNIPLPTDCEPLPSEESAHEACEQAGVNPSMLLTSVAEPQSSKRVPVHIALSIGQKQPRSPTKNMPQKRVKEDVVSDNLRICGTSVVDTWTWGLPPNPMIDAVACQKIQVSTLEMGAVITTWDYGLGDLPLSQLSTADSGNERLNDDSVYREDNTLHIGQEDSNNICQSPHKGDISLPAILLNGDGHNNSPVHWDSPDLCISNNDNDYLPAILPNGNIVYRQDSGHLNIPNGDSHDTSPVCWDLPDLHIGNNVIDVNLPVMLLVFQVCSTRPNDDDAHRQDDSHPNIENGDSNDACQVPHNLPNQCTSNDINLPALDIENGDSNVACQVDGQDDDHFNIENGNSHDSGPVCWDSPGLCIGNDDDVNDLLATLPNGDDQDNDHSNIVNGNRLIDGGTYRQDDGHFDTENEDHDNACQVPHDDDISDDMNVEGSDNWDAEGHDNANGNDRNGSTPMKITMLTMMEKARSVMMARMLHGHAWKCHEEDRQASNNRITAALLMEASRGVVVVVVMVDHLVGRLGLACLLQDKDITLGQLLNGDQVALQNQSVTKGDLIVLASAILDLQDAITQCGTGGATSTVSKLLQPTSTVPKPMGDSDDPMPDYRQKHHSKPKLNLQENVQQHAVYLLKRKNRRQPFPKVASPNEMALYAVTGWGGPTAENFYLDFHGPLTSTWNKHTAKVFTSHFFDCGWYGSPKKDDIKRIFETHMCTLHAHSLLAMLPPNTMSGDETDHQPGQK